MLRTDRGRKLAALAGLAIVLAGADASSAPAPVTPAQPPAILAAIRQPGAAAVLVNVWATWCDPCRAEMPRLARFARAHRAEGLRLVLVSADDEAERDHVAAFLSAQGVDGPSWLKQGDDMAFINALDGRWTGALPVSLLFDGAGHVRELWQGEVSDAELERAWATVVRERKGARTLQSGQGGAGAETKPKNRSQTIPSARGDRQP